MTDVFQSLLRQPNPNPVVIVNGVPGTGKSTFVRALFVHLLAFGRRILVVALTNAALEVLTKALLRNDFKIPNHAVAVLMDADDHSNRRYWDLERFDPRASARDQRLNRLIERIVDIQDRSLKEFEPLAWNQEMINVQVQNHVADVIRQSLPSIQDTVAEFPAVHALLVQIQTSTDASSALQLIPQLRSAFPLGRLAAEYASSARVVFTTVACARTTPVVQFPCDAAIVDDGAHVPELDLLSLWKSSLKSVVLVEDLLEPHEPYPSLASALSIVSAA